MKAPAHPGGTLPPTRSASVPSSAASSAAPSDHRWRRLLLRAVGVVAAVLAVAAAIAWLEHAEGDLRQVSASSETRAA